jgi:hypothetical protein
VQIAEECINESLDFVIIDGNYHQACISAALPMIKKVDCFSLIIQIGCHLLSGKSHQSGMSFTKVQI